MVAIAMKNAIKSKKKAGSVRGVSIYVYMHIADIY